MRVLAKSLNPTFRDVTLLDENPVLTMKNTVDENTDGGAESIALFKDHAGNILAQVKGSHAGASDDFKGDLILYTNTGSGLTERLRIDDSGNIKVSGDSIVISDSSGNLKSANGVNFGSGLANTFTVVDGIVTAISQV